jgi:hypothetical protein
MANESKALVYVGPIMTAYNAAEKAGASALAHALECGKQLNLAKEDVDEVMGKGKWKGWCKQNLPLVSEETERVYRRLADAVAKKENIFAKCKSIRAALQHLSGFDENLNEKPKPVRTSKPRSGSSAAGLDAPETASGLEAELENAAPDEIIKGIQDDTDKLEEVARASVAKLTPEKVCDALTKAWAEDQIKELRQRLSAHLLTLTSAPQDTPAPAPDAPPRRSSVPHAEFVERRV